MIRTGSSRVATAVTSHTTIVANTQEPIPRMDTPWVSTDARISAARVDTSPIPPRNAEAYLLAIFRKNGDRIAWATAKSTTAVMNPEADTRTPGTNHAATSSPIAELPRKTAVRKRKRITG
jgi:hypothetical protein